MNEGVLQFMLRELKVFSASRNFWGVFAAVVLLFTVTGPFGTLEALRFLPRLAYWTSVHVVTWTIAIVFITVTDKALTAFLENRLVRDFAGAFASAVPIGISTQFLHRLWFGDAITLDGAISDAVLALPLSGIFCVICFIALENDQRVASAEAPDQPLSSAGTVPILARLSAQNRGRLLHISVEDHYSLITTSYGRELILLRFSDAIREVGSIPGIQVHRSHWVADEFIKQLRKSNGKLFLIAQDGSEIPVSRTYAADVRLRFDR